MKDRPSLALAGAIAATAAVLAFPSYAADASHPMPGKDTATSRAAQPMAAGPGQSKSSDESPQSSDETTSQGAKAGSKTSAANAGKSVSKSKNRKKTAHPDGAPNGSSYGSGTASAASGTPK
jgi:hypothetical protein